MTAGYACCSLCQIKAEKSRIPAASAAVPAFFRGQLLIQTFFLSPENAFSPTDRAKLRRDELQPSAEQEWRQQTGCREELPFCLLASLPPFQLLWSSLFLSSCLVFHLVTLSSHLRQPWSTSPVSICLIVQWTIDLSPFFPSCFSFMRLALFSSPLPKGKRSPSLHINSLKL